MAARDPRVHANARSQFAERAAIVAGLIAVAVVFGYYLSVLQDWGQHRDAMLRQFVAAAPARAVEIFDSNQPYRPSMPARSPVQRTRDANMGSLQVSTR